VGFDAVSKNKGELIAAGGAVVLLAALFFLPWFDVGGRVAASTGIPMSLDGWQALTAIRWVLLLAITASLALALLTVSQRAPALPVTTSMLTCVLGVLASLLLAFRAIDHSGLSARSGIYVGFVAALAIAYGGFRSLRTESSPFGDPRSIETVSAAPARKESTSAGRSGP
jgi:hypothetical protein